VLERQDQIAAGVVVGKRRAGGGERRRARDARAAHHAFAQLVRKRDAALRTVGRAQEAKRAPTRRAHGLRFGDGRATAEAEGREHEIERRAPGCADETVEAKGADVHGAIMARMGATCQSWRDMNDVPQIFDAKLRRLRRQRAARTFADHGFVAEEVAREIDERLSGMQQTFVDAVWSGAVPPPPTRPIGWILGDAAARFVRPGGLVFEEEHLPFRDRTFDLFASVLTLHATNDLPGALTQVRRSLKAGGLFLAGMFGGRTLNELRTSLAEAEVEIEGGLSPRVAPFVDVRDAGALLQRAGFDLPVADVDVLTVRYAHPLKLLSDLRGMGETNALVERRRSFLKRRVLVRACEVYMQRFKDADGRVPATFEILYLTGWAPANRVDATPPTSPQ